MLSETQIKNLKPKERTFKVPDRDGLYLVVTPSGTKSFRYNYKINGRYETITFGRWKDQITLAEARQKLLEAKRMIASGVYPLKKNAPNRILTYLKVRLSNGLINT